MDPKGEIIPAIRHMCLQKSFDPVLDYLNAVRWDGKSRLNTWLIDYFGADDNPLNRAIGRKVLIAAVRRVRAPGTKFDSVMVLEGPQDLGRV